MKYVIGVIVIVALVIWFKGMPSPLPPPTDDKDAGIVSKLPSQNQAAQEYAEKMRNCLHNAAREDFATHGYYWKRKDYLDSAFYKCQSVRSPFTLGEEAGFLLSAGGEAYQDIVINKR